MERVWGALLRRAGRSGLRGLLGVVASTLVIALGYQQLYKIYVTESFGSTSVLWAATAAFFTATLGLVIVLCGVSYQVSKDEIDRLAGVKKELEVQVLRNRHTSKGKIKRRPEK